MPDQHYRSLKIAFVLSHPIQYFAPLFREIASNEAVDLTVFYCSRQGLDETWDAQFGTSVKWDIPLTEGYRAVFLPNLSRSGKVAGFRSLLNPAIIRELRNNRFDTVVVHGYAHATMWLTFLGAHITKTPIALRGDSNLLSERPRHIRTLKTIVLRALFRTMDAFAYIGKENRDYYRHYGVPERKLFPIPYGVDNDFFQRQATALASQRSELRNSFGITDDRPVILACGKLYEKKQPLELLEAYRRVREVTPCALVYAGDGNLRGEIEKRVRDEAIPDVTVTGFLNQSEISQAYVAADLLAIPSKSEAWGLVINEAMNFGLPIIASDRVGAASDLVHDGKNGVVVPWDRIDKLAEAIGDLVTDFDKRKVFGRNSLAMISDYSLQIAAMAAVSLVDSISK